MGKVNKYIGGLINIISLRKLFEDFSQITGLSIGIYEYPDFKKTLVASEVTSICKDYFRANEKSLNKCILNHQEMLYSIVKTQNTTFCKKCPFGFITFCCPILIDGECIAILVAGQARIKKHSEKEIMQFANDYEFDINKFKQEINNTKLITRKELNNVQNYMTHLAEMISEMSTIHKIVSEKEARLAKQNIELLELKKELAFTKYSIDDSPVPIMWVDNNAIIIDINCSACDHLGYSKKELIGKNVFIIEIAFNKEQWPHLKKEFIRKEVVIIEGIHKNKNGTLIPVEIKIKSQKYKEKEFFICFIRNITEKKILQEELDNEKRNLEQTVITRTLELQNSLKELEKANSSKDQLISNISHELRTPLNAIIGFAEVLNRQYFGNLNQKQTEYIEHISKSGEHLLNLINEILDISRIDSGKAALIKENLNYTTFITEIENLFRDQFMKKQVKLEFYNPDNIEYIFADKKKLKQIIINLLSNSLKFTDANGKVSLRINRNDNQYLLFSITDNGIGIKEDEIEHIFKEFYQAKDIRKKALGGTGIGLALSKRLVNLHGGEIGIESKYKSGSTFWFTLPTKVESNIVKLSKKAIKA